MRPWDVYNEGATFGGRIGRTWKESEPAFPVKPSAPEGAPNVVYIVLDDVGFGWCDTFGGLVETPMLHGYNTFCVGKWHNTPAEEVGPAGPFDRWPTGPLFGFDRFYGFMGGDSDQWYPKLFSDCTPIDQPSPPEALAEGHQSQGRETPSLPLICKPFRGGSDCYPRRLAG